MPALSGRLNRFFDDPFFNISRMADDSEMGMWNPAVDLYEKDDHFVIKAELPGVNKKDIAIDLRDRVLTLSGERSYENEVKEEYIKQNVNFTIDGIHITEKSIDEADRFMNRR